MNCRMGTLDISADWPVAIHPAEKAAMEEARAEMEEREHQEQLERQGILARLQALEAGAGVADPAPIPPWLAIGGIALLGLLVASTFGGRS